MQWTFKSPEGSGSPLQHSQFPRPCHKWQGDKLQSPIFHIIRRRSFYTYSHFQLKTCFIQPNAPGEQIQTWKIGFSLVQVGTFNIGLEELLVIESQAENPGKHTSKHLEHLVAGSLSHTLNYLTSTPHQQQTTSWPCGLTGEIPHFGKTSKSLTICAVSSKLTLKFLPPWGSRLYHSPHH